MQVNPKKIDTIAALAIRAGGVLVVAAMIGIFVEIISVAIPLFKQSSIHEIVRYSPEGTVESFGHGNYGDKAFFVTSEGKINVASLLEPGVPVETFATPTTAGVRSVQWSNNQLFWVDATLGAQVSSFSLRPQFSDEGTRSIVPQLSDVSEVFSEVALTNASEVFFAQRDDDVSIQALVVERKGSIELFFTTEEEDWSGDIETENYSYSVSFESGVDAWKFSGSRMMLAVASGGQVMIYRFSDFEPEANLEHKFAVQGTVSAMEFALGDQSLILGFEDGRSESWMEAQDEIGVRQYFKVHTFPEMSASIASIVRSPIDKSLALIDQKGEVLFTHLTSERELTWIRGENVSAIAFNQRGNLLQTLSANGNLTMWDFSNPHPEVSWQTLFGEVWYEGYSEPNYIWQSSSADNDFEPKLSLIPLIAGTLKATLYAMLFSIPMAILAAVYVSQIMGDKSRAVIKPAVEVMAAFPSVVVGFLAALWFAPFLESNLLALFTGFVLFPVMICFWLLIWLFVTTKPNIARRVYGYEHYIILPILILAGTVSIWIAPVLEQLFWDGSIRQWMFDEAGIRYDQRNSIVIAFGLGFAVIPIVFTMADDAMSNVPKSLSAASMALGASRWQTVWKVVLPSASPGIFAASMIGFGRAVGETMIVLMAAGNTPILDFDWYNGMRTLAANIAVEVPEAPHGGTLYRVLFLSAVLLFMATFFLNTVAEVVRNRLRAKYGRF